MFSNLFFITLPNIEKYFLGIHFSGIHFPRNSLSKKKLLSNKQTEPKKLTIPSSVNYSARQGINDTIKQASLVHRTNNTGSARALLSFKKRTASSRSIWDAGLESAYPLLE